jgi:hypothetical protein
MVDQKTQELMQNDSTLKGIVDKILNEKSTMPNFRISDVKYSGKTSLILGIRCCGERMIKFDKISEMTTPKGIKKYGNAGELLYCPTCGTNYTDDGFDGP